MDKSFITWADYKSSFKWNSKRDTEVQSALDAVTASFSSELGENLFVTWASVNSPKHPRIGLEVQIPDLFERSGPAENFQDLMKKYLYLPLHRGFPCGHQIRQLIFLK